MTKAHNVFLVGAMGSGKTSVGRQLAREKFAIFGLQQTFGMGGSHGLAPEYKVIYCVLDSACPGLIYR